MTHFMTRDARTVRPTTQPTCKHHKVRRSGTNSGTTTVQPSQTPPSPVLESVVSCDRWEPVWGGRVSGYLNSLATLLVSKIRRSALDDTLTALKNLRLELEGYVASNRFKAKGDKRKLAKRVAELRVYASSLARFDTGGCLVVTSGEVLEFGRLISCLIADLRAKTIEEVEDELPDEVAILRQQRENIAKRQTHRQFVSSKRRARAKRRDLRLQKVEPDRVRTQLTRIVIACNGTLWRGDEQVLTAPPAAVEVEIEDLEGWRAFAGAGQSANPWSQYTEGDGVSESSGKPAVALQVLGTNGTPCGKSCNGCAVAANCQHATSGNGTVAEDAEGLFREDGAWREDGGSD